MKKTNGNRGLINIVCIAVLVIIILFSVFDEKDVSNTLYGKKTLRVLSSVENSVVENDVVKYAKKINKRVEFTYMGDLDIVEELNNHSDDYDAVWISNSMWLYMLNNSYLTSDSKSISISPVVLGVKKSKAEALGLTTRSVSNTDIVNLISSKQIKYVMSSVTQTNTGATAYLGFLSALAGNPEVLTEEMIYDPALIEKLKKVFSGVERVSGDESYLEEMFLNDDDYEGVIASESSLININKSLKASNKEELYLIYPSDGVAINDSTFAFIANDRDKEDMFLDIQSYLLSDDGQKMLADKGQRTWYGGITSKIDKAVFNPKWGIDTTKYLSVTKFPSKKVITSAINLYIEELRKPTHVVFCLDYSGSMYGSGNEELVSAMDYILDYEKASKDKLQFSKSDLITVVTFSSDVEDVWDATGHDTTDLIESITRKHVNGSTALYDAIIEGLKVLNNDPQNEYTQTIIAMTDGAVNVGTYSDLSRKYHSLNSKVPIYSITFGAAKESQLREIAELSNAKVFDGRTNLLDAFKDVRGYN